jgi:imidazolonepropionase-like amidohydrolase
VSKTWRDRLRIGVTDLGMSPAAALRAGTRDAAELLGVEADVGTLEAGKTADIVAVPGNVLRRHSSHRASDIRHAPRPHRGAEGGNPGARIEGIGPVE